MSSPLSPKSLSKEDIKKKILEEKDFIKCPRSQNSLEKYLTKSAEIAEDKTIARLLMLEVTEVEEIYQDAISKIREDMDEDES
jgi:hypothetical protein